MKVIQFVVKVIVTALILFISKQVAQSILEYTNIIPVEPKAFIWGMPDRAKYVVGWQFVYTYWLYVLIVTGAFFLLNQRFVRKYSNWKLSLMVSFVVFVFLLIINRFEFPMERTYAPSGQRINYGFFEDLIVFSMVGFLLIFL